MARIKSIAVFLATVIVGSLGESLEFENHDLSLRADTCLELLGHFAKSSSNFTYCAVQNARPIRICEKCVQDYEDVKAAHQKILDMEDGEGNKKCKEQLMNLDRLQVIEEGFKYHTDLWNRASCDYCFKVHNQSLILSNTTIHFMDLFNTTRMCFTNYTLGNDTYSQEVCAGCEKAYCDMNKYYDSLKNSQDFVCMDIVDSMNLTRMMWNDKLKCKKIESKMDITYIACSSIIALLPIIFYLGAKLFTTVIRNQLQAQKRLAEILRPTTSTSGEH